MNAKPARRRPALRILVTGAPGGINVRLGVNDDPDGAGRQRKALLTSLTDRLLAGLHTVQMGLS